MDSRRQDSRETFRPDLLSVYLRKRIRQECVTFFRTSIVRSFYSRQSVPPSKWPWQEGESLLLSDLSLLTDWSELVVSDLRPSYRSPLSRHEASTHTSPTPSPIQLFLVRPTVKSPRYNMYSLSAFLFSLLTPGEIYMNSWNEKWILYLRESRTFVDVELRTVCPVLLPFHEIIVVTKRSPFGSQDLQCHEVGLQIDYLTELELWLGP